VRERFGCGPGKLVQQLLSINASDSSGFAVDSAFGTSISRFPFFCGGKLRAIRKRFGDVYVLFFLYLHYLYFQSLTNLHPRLVKSFVPLGVRTLQLDHFNDSSGKSWDNASNSSVSSSEVP
jgi:hypothetical protein